MPIVHKATRLAGVTLVVLLFFSVISGVMYNFTSSKTVDIIAAAIITVGFVALSAWKAASLYQGITGFPRWMVRLYRREVEKEEKRRAAKKATLLIVVAALMILAIPRTAVSRSTAEFGGIAWSASVDRNMGHAALPGSFWAKVWYTGHSPVGAYEAYRWYCKVTWSTTTRWYTTTRFGRVLGWRFVGSPQYSCNIEDHKPTVQFDKKLDETVERVTCKIEGLTIRNGCWKLTSKAQVIHTIPPGFGVSSLVGEPAVKLIISPRGEVVWYWWKQGKINL